MTFFLLKISLPLVVASTAGLTVISCFQQIITQMP